MIPKREIDNLAAEWELRHDVVEKDYVLGWLLAGISRHPIAGNWSFKGGTSLRKCWFETYRFSEDLDFTVDEDSLDPVRLAIAFGEIGAWLQETAGLAIHVAEASFRLRKNRRGRPTIQGRISYSGPLGSPSPPKVKLDLTADEIVVLPLEPRPILHPFSDATTTRHGDGHLGHVLSYALPELLGEKLRALVERCRPRDLYDVIHMYRHSDLIGHQDTVAQVLEAKCDHAGISVPTHETLMATRFREEIESEWESMLGHQLPVTPPFHLFWDEVETLFAWLDGTWTLPELPTASLGESTDWRPSRFMTTWQNGLPMERIRFAGANRLKVNIDYHPIGRGSRAGPRVVEPYSLRRSRAGHLLLYVVNDHGQLRGYRVDHIRGVWIEPERFEPRFAVEF